MANQISLSIDGQTVTVPEGTTILQAAETVEIEIPRLCYFEGLPPSGSCRLCLVDVFDGRRSKVVTSCIYPAKEGIEVTTDSEKVLKARRGVMELTLARSPKSPRVVELAKKMGVDVDDHRLARRQCTDDGRIDRAILCLSRHASGSHGRPPRTGLGRW